MAEKNAIQLVNEELQRQRAIAAFDPLDIQAADGTFGFRILDTRNGKTKHAGQPGA